MVVLFPVHIDGLVAVAVPPLDAGKTVITFTFDESGRHGPLITIAR